MINKLYTTRKLLDNKLRRKENGIKKWSKPEHKYNKTTIITKLMTVMANRNKKY